MEKIQLKYNPYTVEVVLLYNEKSFEKKEIIKKIKGRRLQEWIESFAKELTEELVTDECELFFYGTSVDYSDVEYAFKKMSSDSHAIKTSHIKPKITEENKLEQIKELFYSIQYGPFKELKTHELTKAFCDVLSNTFEVSVIATMSSGKSTLINALMRQELLPSQNQACTAVVTKIIDDNRESDTFNAIQYSTEGKQLRVTKNVTLTELIDWNDDQETSEVQIVGDIPFTDSKTTKLVLVDTPGPNNANNKDHSKTTYESLDKSAKTLIIYVLNATQLGTNDDYRLLKRISESMRIGGGRLRDRFLFVVNKLDVFNSDNEPIKSVLENVKEYLESIGIEDPNIYAASAREALNIRTMNLITDSLKESMEHNNVDELSKWLEIKRINENKDHFFEKYAPSIPSLQRDIQEQLSKAKENNNQKEEALIHTGLPSIEAGINLYLKKYATPQKIKTLFDTFNNEIIELKIEKSFSQYQINRKNLVNKIDNLKNDIKIVESAIVVGEQGRIDILKKNLEATLINYNSELIRIDYKLDELTKNKEWLLNIQYQMNNIMQLN